MRSITYGGHDLAAYCSAEVTLRGAHAVDVTSQVVPGRAGALVESTHMAPLDIRVRLMLRVGSRTAPAALAGMRHTLLSWLMAPDGGTTLVLPDEPALTYHNVVCVDASGWDHLFEDGECEVAFVAYDPVAWGATRSVSTRSFEVGGTWRTWPTMRLVATKGPAVDVVCGTTGAYVRMERSFSGGEVVDIDCARETLYVSGVDARAGVTLGSDFFPLTPGAQSLVTTGCGEFTANFTERWV